MTLDKSSYLCYYMVWIKNGTHKNMSGIYILKTKDGYRVTHSHRYDDLVGFDSNGDYFIDGKVAKSLFSNCFKYDKLDDAIEHARAISKNHWETDDGIREIKYAEHMTFKELIKHG